MKNADKKKVADKFQLHIQTKYRKLTTPTKKESQEKAMKKYKKFW